MNEERRRVVTEEEVARLHEARRTGGICAACGRALGAGETVYQEQFLIGAKRLHTNDVLIYASVAVGPVGSECASAALLEQTAGMEPERCAGCGRGVHYREQRRPTRHHAICSRRCSNRAASVRRAARPKAED